MLNCIHGHGPMTRINKKGVDIDFCPVCGGVWLDKGELEKLIEMSNQSQVTNNMANAPDLDFDDNQPQRPTQQYSNHDHHNNHNNHGNMRRKKKEGFLGDMFDFDIF